jgi:hypothetical protein
MTSSKTWPTNEYVNFVIRYVMANTTLDGHEFDIEGRFSLQGVPNARLTTEYRGRTLIIDVYSSDFFYVRLGSNPPGTCTGVYELVLHLGRVLYNG